MTEETPLVLDAEVKAVCAELDADASTTTFITTAHIFVYESLSDKGMSETRLKQIELYLASHFAAITNPVASFESVGKVQESLQYKVDVGLRFTKYGQQAIALDSSGTLSSMSDGKIRQAGMDWLGMTDNEQLELLPGV